MITRNILAKLREARMVLKQQMQPCLRLYDLTEQQWRVLRILNVAHRSGREGADTGHIAKEARILPSTLTGVLDRLERDGRVTRQRSAKDARIKLVQATPSGLDLVKVVSQALTEEYQRIERQIDRADLEQRHALLEKVIALEVREDEG